MTIYLPPLDETLNFPDVETALSEPDGLLAIGGDLSPSRLLAAYRNGIFPWFGEEDPYLWWSPSERAVFWPEHFQPSRSLKKHCRKNRFFVTINTSFEQVIERCATIRGSDAIWITEDMRQAYTALHQAGHAHSVEIWDISDNLVGGLYGISVGQVFCGESMFSSLMNGSKIALWAFCQHFAAHGGKIIDCQMMNPHLESLGASPISRQDFIRKLSQMSDTVINDKCFAPGPVTWENPYIVNK
ncbi:leucyl/phenylalanyl-tRNA--protein transferase [Parasalinivibrio latis]|uniref:leucyl/phenylalanyl-tRNA--protein transferase n=1 Tax=Parasalinivibrio latis TaxID=2952610 RepID=UPI0030DDFCDF